MSVELSKAFSAVTKAATFKLEDHLVPNELNPKQSKHVDKVKELLEGNLVGDPTLFGGKLDEEKFKEFKEALLAELGKEEYKSLKGKLEKSLENYLEALKKVVEELVVGFFPVKDMPTPSITFRTVPLVRTESKTPLKFTVMLTVAFACEVQCVVNRTTLFGEMKGEAPLFAPLIGEMDLGGFKLTPDMKAPTSENFAYLEALLKSMSKMSTRNNVTRYHAQYQRHGEPICDFFMKDEQLMKSMEKVTSGVDSKRLQSGAAVAALVKPHAARTLVLVHDEKPDLEVALEALLNLSAACYESPMVRKTGHVSEAEAMTAAAPTPPPSPGVGALAGPGPASAAPPPRLPVWTEEELAEEAKKRGTAPNLPVWTEEELAEEAKKRGLPTDLEYWTEEELEAERKKSHAGTQLNIPEWEVSEDTPECPKCGYTVRKGWDTCPICDEPLDKLWEEGAAAEKEEKPATAPAEQAGTGTPGAAKPTPKPLPGKPAAKPPAKPPA
ncbi:MAG: hypothetical protein Kow0069_32920 [Promethearchaeota archaeon]